MRAIPIVLAAVCSFQAFAQDATKPAQWQEWLRLIVADIETSSRQGNADLLSRRINRPTEFLATSHQLPERFNLRIHCTLAAQSAANYALSLRQGKAPSARADLAEYRRYDKDCGAAISQFERHATLSKIAPPRPADPDKYPATETSPVEWLSAVKYDAASARDAARVGRVNLDVLRAVAGSALAHRTKIAAWTPSPKRSEAYGICGDAVIALARVADAPKAALETYFELEPRCAAAIGKP